MIVSLILIKKERRVDVSSKRCVCASEKMNIFLSPEFRLTFYFALLHSISVLVSTVEVLQVASEVGGGDLGGS